MVLWPRCITVSKWVHDDIPLLLDHLNLCKSNVCEQLAFTLLFEIYWWRQELAPPCKHQNVDNLLQVGLPGHRCRVTRHSPEAHRVTLPLVPDHPPNALLGARRPMGRLDRCALPWSFWWSFGSRFLISLYFTCITPWKAYQNKCSSREPLGASNGTRQCNYWKCQGHFLIHHKPRSSDSWVFTKD
jgi:hypothetical protein